MVLIIVIPFIVLIITSFINICTKADITPEQESQYREVFKIFDKDGDGNITKNELAKVIKNLGVYNNPIIIANYYPP